jgi:hypothetical protein
LIASASIQLLQTMDDYDKRAHEANELIRQLSSRVAQLEATVAKLSTTSPTTAAVSASQKEEKPTQTVSLKDDDIIKAGNVISPQRARELLKKK